jgi:membrane protease YdiL (CAAX protease family)
MSDLETQPIGFWNRPASWKAVLLVVGYLVFFLAVSQVVALVFDDQIDGDNVVGDAESTFFALVLPIGIGGLALLAFTAKVGWLGDIFGPQPIRGRRWMWTAPVLVLTIALLRFIGTDWDTWSADELLMLAVLGVCIGVTEELATRGLVVKMLRDAGHAERYVAVVSSLLFAAMHMTNLISGMALNTVLATVAYTFCFGMCMYLSMRVTGSFVTVIVLHGLTDPSGILASGGVDQSVDGNTTNAPVAIAGLLTTVLLVFAVVAAFRVRGKVGADPREARQTAL